MTSDFGTTKYCKNCGFEIVKEGDCVTMTAGSKFCECDKKVMEKDITNLREKLSELEHQQWANWTFYFFTHILDEGQPEKWKKQVVTLYKDLSEKEKDSDRFYADKVLELFNSQIQKVKDELKKKLSYKSFTWLEQQKIIEEIFNKNFGEEKQ